MPYIEKADRAALRPDSDIFADDPGALNFQITCLIDNYLAGSMNYRGINDVLGALEGAKLELYRRIAAPYEDTKIRDNGDVYTGFGND